MNEFDPTRAEILTRLLTDASERMPASAWRLVAAELEHFLGDRVTEASHPSLHRLFVRMPGADVEHGIHLARVISRAASTMPAGQRDYLWWELWKFFQDRPSLPRDLAVAIDVLLANELR